MIPLFFGPADRAKYGVFHPAIGGGSKGRGIVFCDAHFNEALRAHRTLRFASDSMAAARWNSLRFDYYGTGDSAGDTEEFSVRQAIQDVHDAIAELKSSASLEHVYLLGLRLGGTLAMQAAVSRDDVRGIVLWDPIVDGAAFVNYFDEVAEPDGEETQWEGFGLTESLRSELGDLSLRPSLAEFAGPVLMACTSPTAEQREVAAMHPHVELREFDAPEAWTKAPGGGARPIPSAVIQDIQAWTG